MARQGRSRRCEGRARAFLLLPVLLLSAAGLLALRHHQHGAAGEREMATLRAFQHNVAQCVQRNGLGLQAEVKDECRMELRYPAGTNSTWYSTQFRRLEPTSFELNVCDAVQLWEQYRNVTTVLTREYLDARPDGWLEYAAKRIAQLGSEKCYNRSRCEEELQLVLPARPPFRPRQFRTCAVVGNSGDLLKREYGAEIDAHDAVFRENEAEVSPAYAKHVGMKRTFRLIGRGIARSMERVVEGAREEVVVIKSLIHRDFNAKIRRLPNPVYLFQGVVLRRGAKGTGIKAVELALSMCDSVDMYGFTVDPGYSGWTRYFSASRTGHNPLQGRAYYQLLECLGVLRIHSPMRDRRRQDWSVVPGREAVRAAYDAVVRLKGREPGPFSSCRVWADGREEAGPVSGAPDMSEVRRASEYSKWEKLGVEELRPEAQEHLRGMQGVSLYKLDGNKLDDLVCVRHNSASA